MHTMVYNFTGWVEILNRLWVSNSNNEVGLSDVKLMFTNKNLPRMKVVCTFQGEASLLI